MAVELPESRRLVTIFTALIAVLTVAVPIGAFRGLLEVPTPSSGEIPEFGAVRGFRHDKLMPLGADTWVYDGTLTLPAPV